MFFIPGRLIALLTFPGVICHEIAHRLFCDLTGTPVHSVCYFRVGNPAGYVVHSQARNLRSALLISLGPLLLNSFLCAVISFSAVIPIFTLEVSNVSFATGFMMWLGISIGMHAFPSGADMAGFRAATDRLHGNRGLRVAATWLTAVFAVANLARIVWFDAVYACLVAFATPAIVLHFYWN